MALEAARALVPWWVVPVAVLVHAAAAFSIAFALGAALCALGRHAIRRPAPWPVRARRLSPPRAAMTLAAWVVPIGAGVHLAIGRSRFLGGGAAVIVAAVVASSMGLAYWRYRLTRSIVVAGYTVRDALAASATSALVLHASSLTALLIAVAMPSRTDAVAAALLAVGAALLVLIGRGGAFGLARALGLAPEAPPEIAGPIRSTAERAGIRLAGVHQIRLPEANAVTMLFASRIAFTVAALSKIDLQGLLAIGRHEVAHLAEPEGARRLRLANLLALFPVMCAKPVFAAFGLPAAALVVVLALFLRQALRRRQRAMETRADAGARDPDGTYARALEEIHRLNLVPVARGAATLAYPPPPPPSLAVRLGLVALVAAAYAVEGLWWTTPSRDHPWTAVAFDGGLPWTLAYVAGSRDTPGDAALFYAAARVLDPGSPDWPGLQSMALADAGRIDEAERALAEAERLGLEAEHVAKARERIERAR